MYPNLLLNSLAEPRTTAGLSHQDWGTLLRLARSTKLLPRLANSLAASGVLPDAPEKVREQVLAQDFVASHNNRSIHWELDRIQCALQGTGIIPVLLKGAAYVIGEFAMGSGRGSRDIDFLVRREDLSIAESALKSHGWEPLSADEYDDHYYRTWMHELPPLRHRDRRTVVDVHHNILPLSGRLHPDASLLLDAARPIANRRFRVLAPADMLLHAAAHLFQDGEVFGGLRDLTDLDIMLRYFGDGEPGFWEQLIPRAKRLELTRPLYYALRFSQRFIKTPISDAIAAEMTQFGPSWAVRQLMDSLAARAFIPELGDGEPWGHRFARLALYARSHWLRMPPLLLARHLAFKAFGPGARKKAA